MGALSAKNLLNNGSEPTLLLGRADNGNAILFIKSVLNFDRTILLFAMAIMH